MRNIFSKPGLQIKVSYTMLLSSVIPLLALVIFSLYSLDFYHKLDLTQIESVTLNSVAASTKSVLSRVLETFQVQVTYNQAADISIPDQHLILAQLMAQFPELEEASILSGSSGIYGQETSVLSRSADGVFKPSEELVNQSKNPKFIQAIQGKSYVSPVYYTTGGPMVTIASPVTNTPKSGSPAVIAVLTGELRLTAIQRLVSEAQLGNTGYVYLQDGNGFLVSQQLKNTATGSLLPRETDTNLVRYKNNWNEDVVGMALTLPELKSTLVAQWPAVDADEIVNTVRQQMLIGTILVLSLALFLSFYLARRIVRPIKMLEAGTKRVALGKFDRQITIDTDDELSQLGEAFNNMQDGLKRLEELKEEFVFVASHELRTPVTAIKGYLSMILDGEAGAVSDEVKPILSQVMSANDRLVQLVDDLLAVARSEAGRLTIEVAENDIAPIIQSVLSELQPLAKQKQIQLIYNSDPGLPKILADPARLKEVLVNLVGNAIKYTKGTGSVTINHKLNKQNLVTSVVDQGIGMTSEEQTKLFGKFYRAKNADTKNIQGTGLGLFITKQIIEKMGGKIWVASEKGKGSTFSFSLVIAKGKK